MNKIIISLFLVFISVSTASAASYSLPSDMTLARSICYYQDGQFFLSGSTTSYGEAVYIWEPGVSASLYVSNADYGIESLYYDGSNLYFSDGELIFKRLQANGVLDMDSATIDDVHTVFQSGGSGWVSSIYDHQDGYLYIGTGSVRSGVGDFNPKLWKVHKGTESQSIWYTNSSVSGEWYYIFGHPNGEIHVVQAENNYPGNGLNIWNLTSSVPSFNPVVSYITSSWYKGAKSDTDGIIYYVGMDELRYYNPSSGTHAQISSLGNYGWDLLIDSGGVIYVVLQDQIKTYSTINLAGGYFPSSAGSSEDDSSTTGNPLLNLDSPEDAKEVATNYSGITWILLICLFLMAAMGGKN
ncbi:hypothetical protein SAMN04488589_0502 [Methanolobus vulcani]|uniref:Uncharacterized protein n=1 Tax=Methanolobus vulcani TaxID=38026 RepID=A0A7Z7AUR5_9EURY|nr:hypothetical protein [Methanolobus vulcani]SDF43282.1 hypothetical protein SAMN04488589_0502 [Methanolobus vulcani]